MAKRWAGYSQRVGEAEELQPRGRSQGGRGLKERVWKRGVVRERSGEGVHCWAASI